MPGAAHALAADVVPDPVVDPVAPVRALLAAQGHTPFAFQEEVWAAYARGESGLLHAPTGMGKTWAAWLGPLALGPEGAEGAPPPLTVVWIMPLRALASDTGLALTRAAQALKPHWTVDVRTGDTPASARTRQDGRLPLIVRPLSGSCRFPRIGTNCLLVVQQLARGGRLSCAPLLPSAPL